MRWISLLYGRIGLKLAASGGVFTWQDSVKMLLSGADVVHMTSALLQYGPGRLSETLAGITTWMEEKQFATLDAFRGSLSQQAAADTSALTREGYVMLLDNYATRSEDA
jgi:dihydroorotate dehydrogenase (fumarate)